MRARRARAAACAILAVVGCTPHAPRIGHPTRVVSYCGSKEARMTGVDSVMTSTDDVLLDDRPTERDVQNAVRGGDGVLASFDDQPLAIPRVAAALGESDGYVRVREVAIAVAPDGALSRRIYLKVRERGGSRWILMNAFDVQNVCVEGKRQS